MFSFSNMKVPQKLGILAILFVVAVFLAATQFWGRVTAVSIDPAQNELKGIALNQKVLEVQRKYTEFYLAYMRAQNGGESSGLAAAGDAASAAFRELEKELTDFYGEAGAKGILSPISTVSYIDAAKNPESRDPSMPTEMVRLLTGMSQVAQSVGQKTYLYQNPNTQVTTATEVIYGSVMPAIANVASVVGNSGKKPAKKNAPADPDALEDFDDGSGGGGAASPEDLQSIEAHADKLESFMGQISGNKSDNAVLEGMKKLEMPLLKDFTGNQMVGNELLASAFKYIDDYQKLLATDAQTRLSRASTYRALLGTIAFLVLMVGSAAFWMISRDLLLGVEKALNVARSISRDGDLSVGEKYAHKRKDELGDLLDEMAHMTQSLNATATVAQNIAAGDLMEAKIAPRSEHDKMGQALQNMVESLRGQIGATKDSAGRVAETAKSILAATSQVAATASQMATSISEATTTAEEVRQTASLAEAKAKTVAQSAGEAASVSVVGQQRTQMTLDEMDKIRGQMETIAESIVRLSEQGQAIGDIITTVNDIAEQSNVLAVNASIEAAKAGEHGRGFAVVAQEVKSLADESKTATSAIRAILSDIERATAAAVMLAEQGTKSAQASVERSKEAGSSIRDLGTRVVQAAQSSAQISASASQQLAGVDQVVDAMVSIKDGSSQIVESVNLVKSAAAELSELSATLQKNIQTYKV